MGWEVGTCRAVGGHQLVFAISWWELDEEVSENFSLSLLPSTLCLALLPACLACSPTSIPDPQPDAVAPSKQSSKDFSISFPLQTLSSSWVCPAAHVPLRASTWPPIPIFQKGRIVTFIWSSNSPVLGPYFLDFLTVIECVFPTVNLLFHNTHRISASLIEPWLIWGGWGTIIQIERR